MDQVVSSFQREPVRNTAGVVSLCLPAAPEEVDEIADGTTSSADTHFHNGQRRKHTSCCGFGLSEAGAGAAVTTTAADGRAAGTAAASGDVALAAGTTGASSTVPPLV